MGSSDPDAHYEKIYQFISIPNRDSYTTSTPTSDIITHTLQEDVFDSNENRYNLSNLQPQVACPPKPDQVVGISELGDVPITRAFIGSCTGGKLFDLASVAEVLKGHHIAPGVDMFVVPASQEVRQKAEQLGYLKIFEEAGVQVLKSGCGACINAGIGGLRKEETGVYATNRNFKGRSGDPTAKNYLASPRVVAISAVRGKISDKL